VLSINKCIMLDVSIAELLGAFSGFNSWVSG